MKNLEKLFIDLSIVAVLVTVIVPFLGGFDKIFGKASTLAAFTIPIFAFGGFFVIGKNVRDKILAIVSIALIPIFALNALNETLLPNIALLPPILFILFGWRLLHLNYGGYLAKLAGLAAITYSVLLLIFIKFSIIMNITTWFMLGVLLSYRFNYKPKIKKFW